MDNPFKKILDKASSFFVVENTSDVVGIDIGSSSIKIVEIKKKDGKAVLETYGMIELGPYADVDAGKVTNLPPEKIVEALMEVLKQSGVAVKSAALSLPVQSSLIFSIDLPPQVKESDLSTIVPTEARRYIPVPITEVSIDYFVLPKKELSFEEANNQDSAALAEGKTEVLVVAIQNDAISKYRSIVSQSGIDVGFFEVEIFSSVRANFEHELSLVLLIDFGASRTKLSLVEFGIVKSFHIVGRGGADITESIARSFDIPFAEAEKMKKEYGLFGNGEEAKLAETIKIHTDYIFSEINNVLLGYEKKYNRTISKVVFSGGGALLKGLKEEAENNFKAEVQMGHPFNKVGAPVFLEKVLNVIGPEFAIAVGLALRKLK